MGKSIRTPMLGKIGEHIYDGINNLSLEELEALYKECDNVTTTNCWWMAYGVANLIKGVIYTKIQSMTSAEKDR